MSTVTISSNKTEVLDWAREKKENATPKMESIVNEILSMYWTLAVAFAPKKTGALSESHETEQSGLSGVMYPKAEHALYVILGTKPHPIEPVHAKVLAWYWGEWHFAKHVDHPGTSPNDYIQDIYEDSQASVESILEGFSEWLVE